jgi:hypothetical protein
MILRGRLRQRRLLRHHRLAHAGRPHDDSRVRREPEAGASFDDGEARLAAIARVGVHEIIHDWKWLDCEADVSKLRQLGVRCAAARRNERPGRGRRC